MNTLYLATIAEDISIECVGEEELGLQIGDMVLIQCERYIENVRLTKVVKDGIENWTEYEEQRAARNKGRHIEGNGTPRILRKATDSDMAVIAGNDDMTAEAWNRTKERIAVHQLAMKIVQTHYSYDRRLLLIQFSAEGRVDFRELLKDLSTLFRVRVELRQIGVRDEAGVLGGVGTCGRVFCCKQFLTGFSSINVKMAKQQGVAMGQQNVSGCCGRLKCCLAFEAEYYRENPVKKAPQPPKNDGESREGNGERRNGKNNGGEPRPPRENRNERKEPRENKKKAGKERPAVENQKTRGPEENTLLNQNDKVK